MTLMTHEEEEMLAKVRALDPEALKAIWAVKGTVGGIDAAVKALSAKVDALEAVVKELAAEIHPTPVVQTPVGIPWGAKAAATAPFPPDQYSEANKPVS